MPAQAEGDEIAYITNDSRSIHLVQADGTGDRQLPASASLRNLAWAPDGKQLAYTTSQLNAMRPPTTARLSTRSIPYTPQGSWEGHGRLQTILELAPGGG